MEKKKLKFNSYDSKVYTLEDYTAEYINVLSVEAILERWNNLPDVTIGYDSRADTLSHQRRVSTLIGEFCSEMLERASKHDNSKLSDAEKPIFDRVTYKLKNLTYDSPEYKESLKNLGTALVHHYKNNNHHPEHYTGGVDEMNLFDILEMFADWKAATERHDDGCIYTSIKKNKKRFGISKQLTQIFINTAKMLKWPECEKQN